MAVISQRNGTVTVMEKEQESRFEHGGLITNYFRLALPVVLGSIVTIVYNLADTYFISQTENTSLIAGVSVCAPIFTILMAFGNIFGQGGSSLLSRLLGQKRPKDARRVSAFCFWIALATGAAVGGLALVLRDPFLSILGASADSLPHAREYGTVLMLGAPLITVNFIHMNLLRCDGKAALSMTGTLIGAAVNIILDSLLIPGMGACGAAIATVIGYGCSDLFLFFIAARFSAVLSVRPLLRIEEPFLKDVLSIGVTAAITNIAGSICMILLNRQLLPYGDDRIAAMGIVLKVTMIVQMILVGFSFGGVPLFGYLSGAGRQDRIRKLLRFCLLFLVSLSLLMTLVIVLAAAPLLSLVTPDEQLVTLGVPMLRRLVSGCVFAGVVMLLTCLCQASGKAGPALILSLSRQSVVFAVVLLIASRLFGYEGILASQPAADLLSAVLAVLIVRRILTGIE